MQAFLIELSRLSMLMAGNSPEAAKVVQQLREQSPAAWESDPGYEEISVGAALEEHLTTGEARDWPNVAGRGLQLLCRALGELLDSTSFDDANFMLVAEALEGVKQAEKLYGRVPPPLQLSEEGGLVIGYVTPTEAAEILGTWPEPDHDDPAPEVYAAREQLEGWLRIASEAQKSLIVFWD
jgi:hypothetical protein